MSLPGELPLPNDRHDQPEEQIPEEMLVKFVDDHTDISNPRTTLYLEHAPNTFPDGPIANYLGTGSEQGYEIGEQLGNSLTDRAIPGDGHRFHDGGHIAIAVVTGYSATFRSLCRVQRRSRPDVDDTEDGPRAIIQEESLLNSLSQGLAVPGAKAASVIRGVSQRAVAEITPHLQEGTYIPVERWQEAFSVGHMIMTMLDEHIGQITEADRQSIGLTQSAAAIAQQQQAKQHAAWLYVDRREGEIHFSGVSGEHAMSGQAMKIRRFVNRSAALNQRHARDPHRPVIMGTVNGVTYGFPHSSMRRS